MVKMGWARGRAALNAAISFSFAFRAKVSVMAFPLGPICVSPRDGERSLEEKDAEVPPSVPVNRRGLFR
jgi:hypothetical protein